MKGRWLREAWDYILRPFSASNEMSRSIREEIEFHLAEEARARMEHGESSAAACAGAVEQFGSIESAVRGCQEAATSGLARWHRAHLASTAVLVAAVATVSALAWSFSREQPIGDGDITGRVVDEELQPVANAHVLAVVKTWPRQAFRQLAYVAVTRSDGSFEIEDVYPTDEKYAVQIAVVADGRQLESSYVELREGRLEPIDFKLARAAAPVTVTFQSKDGQPLEGVEVFPHQRVEADGGHHVVYFCSGGPVVRETDARGQVALPYFSAGDKATVFLRKPGGEWDEREFVVGGGREVVVTVGDESEHSNSL